MRRYLAKEADLCAQLSDVLTKDGWSVYHEVRLDGVPGALDLCGVRVDEKGEKLTLAVQAKVGLTLAAYSQALDWCDYSTFSAVAFAGRYPDRTLTAVAVLGRRCGIGLYRLAQNGIVTVVEPQKMASLQTRVDRLAAAARLSSNGTLIPGGSRSPKRARPTHLEAEKVLERMKHDSTPNQSLRGILGEVSKQDMDAVAKVLQKAPGRSLVVRKYGSDYLVSYR